MHNSLLTKSCIFYRDTETTNPNRPPQLRRSKLWMESIQNRWGRNIAPLEMSAIWNNLRFRYLKSMLEDTSKVSRSPNKEHLVGNAENSLAFVNTSIILVEWIDLKAYMVYLFSVHHVSGCARFVANNWHTFKKNCLIVVFGEVFCEEMLDTIEFRDMWKVLRGEKRGGKRMVRERLFLACKW